MTALIFDTETHDSKEPEIIEAAWLEVDFGNPTIAKTKLFIDDSNAECFDGGIVMLRKGVSLGDVSCSISGPFTKRFRPSKPITLGALSTHHIMDEDLADCPPSSSFVLPPCDYIIGHKVDFDWEAAGSPDVKRICTLALCRELWPDADSHNQSAMLYLLDRSNAREALKQSHSAAADVLTCKTILDKIIAKIDVKSWQELWARSESARIPKIMPFGKHKGMPMKDVPFSYKTWMSGQPDVDPYLRIALRGNPARQSEDLFS